MGTLIFRTLNNFPVSFDQNLLLICLVISWMAGLLMRHHLTGYFLRAFPYF